MILTVIASVLIAVGLAGFQRRDVWLSLDARRQTIDRELESAGDHDHRQQDQDHDGGGRAHSWQ